MTKSSNKDYMVQFHPKVFSKADNKNHRWRLFMKRVSAPTMLEAEAKARALGRRYNWSIHLVHKYDPVSYHKWPHTPSKAI